MKDELMHSSELLPFTILIVDPDEIIRCATAEVLSTLCFIQEASSITEARELMEMVPVHVLLMRDQQPDGDIIELCKYAMNHSPNTVRMLYGHAPTVTRVLQAINHGEVWRYLEAQWDPDRIYRIVKQAIDQYNLKAGADQVIEQLHAQNDLLTRKVEQRTREVIALGEELRIALDKLQSLTVNDELTGLYNRRNMAERLLEAFRQARRYKTPLSCVVFDITNFKEFNNEYGQEVGDALLQEVGLRISSHIRDVDIACRAGNDDFALILPHTDAAGARIIAERLHQVLTSIPYRTGGEAYSLSFTIGIAELTPSINSAVELFNQAEEAGIMARKLNSVPALCVYPGTETSNVKKPLYIESAV